MFNIYLFLSFVFFLTFILGRLVQKFRIPWIFSSLLLGSFLAIHNPFQVITNSEVFLFLSNLGMYFLLFIIGFETDLRKVNKNKFFIVKATFTIIFFTAVLGALLIHLLFDYSWFVSSIVALSFSTVGEAILVPILDEFKMINSKLGQAILSIGTLDDVLEISTLVLVIFFVGSGIHGHFNIMIVVSSLLTMFVLTFSLSKLKTQNEQFNFVRIESLFLFVIAILFLFLGIGALAEATALGAVLAGVGVRTFIPDKRLKVIENEVKAVCYGFFAPLFFLWAGLSLDFKYLTSSPLIILAVVFVSAGAKFIASFLSSYKELGFKNTLLLATGLSVRFSTSIVVVKILYENNIIGNDLYSVIIASSIVFTFIIPLLFSYFLKNKIAI